MGDALIFLLEADKFQKETKAPSERIKSPAIPVTLVSREDPMASRRLLVLKKTRRQGQMPVTTPNFRRSVFSDVLSKCCLTFPTKTGKGFQEILCSERERERDEDNNNNVYPTGGMYQ